MSSVHFRSRRILGALASAAVIAAGTAIPIHSAVAAPSSAAGSTTITSTGLKPGQVKHVWLIILENKSYDSTFTGLNQNSYLWKTLPSQGALLKDYYGTGHYSMDNYTSMVSGQSASMDVQSDCDVANTNMGSSSSIVTAHSGSTFGQTDNYGQVMANGEANSPDGENGCTYPKDVPTLFNQLDAAGVSWKGYAQDLRNQPGREDGLAGSPGTLANNPTTNPRKMQADATDKANGITSFTGAQANDQYVAKHFPLPWFHSIVGDKGDGSDALTTPVNGGTDSDSSHIANSDDPSNGLVSDLSKPSDQVPAFNWITPNNCSDAHDAVCVGNNMSGVFDDNGNPDYSLPLNTPPKNYTGGLYAGDLWLKYYIPLIEKSAAFQDGGLIDITFDEANPPFYGMSFDNATDSSAVAQDAKENEKYQYGTPGPAASDPGYDQYPAGQFPQPGQMAKNYVNADAAGQNINGQNVNWEPTGPNSTLGTDDNGNQLYPGPGDNGFITRPPSCEQDTKLVNADKSNCVEGAKNTGSAFSGATEYVATAAPGSITVNLPGSAQKGVASTKDIGRAVTGTGIPAGAYVGQVANAGPNKVSTSSQAPSDATITLVDKNGTPLPTTAAVTDITLSATGVPGHLESGQTPLDTFNAQDATPGGGDTGSVLISPLIKPGTTSEVNYNHYSWLRTMEDIFQVSNGKDHNQLTAGTVSGGLDDLGHLGYAAQAGLMPFGTDVFNNLPEDQQSASPSPSASASGSPSDTVSASPSASGSAPASPSGAPSASAPASEPASPSQSSAGTNPVVPPSHPAAPTGPGTHGPKNPGLPLTGGEIGGLSVAAIAALAGAAGLTRFLVRRRRH
ncbi:phosphoesterase [Propionibacterium sp.]|uniref:phosphoesterase n=1 Tax=Propionibacterium sp. TaxID=1977903 RepID=UPI0039EC2D5C